MRDSAEWAERIERGLVRITTITLLEMGYSARSADDMADQFDLLGYQVGGPRCGGY
jgi:predicted nucleic acid-binding protein